MWRRFEETKLSQSSRRRIDLNHSLNKNVFLSLVLITMTLLEHKLDTLKLNTYLRQRLDLLLCYMMSLFKYNDRIVDIHIFRTATIIFRADMKDIVDKL